LILASLLVALCIASVVGAVLKRRYGTSPQIENLNARIRSWWILVVAGGAALLAGQVFVTALFAFLSFAALREFITDRSSLRISYCLVPVQYVLIATDWYARYSPAIDLGVLTGVAICAYGMHLKGRRPVACWGVLLCVFWLSAAPALMKLRILGYQGGYEGRAALLTLFLVLISQVSDILQYIFGKLLGRHLVAPSISPSKTVEGLAGAVVSTTALGAMLWRVTPFSPWQSGLMALLITLLGFLGGLLMSSIKRGRGIKDWGSLIPGHGGILDRIDSLFLSAPVFYHLTRYFFAREYRF
jgi:phosphatidate cytidylyltransferase